MCPQPLTPEEVQRIYATKSYILNHLHLPLRMAGLARRSALGLRKFSEGFRSVFGTTASRYLYESRLATARVLLLHTDKPLKEIAQVCGYPRYKNFLTAYRRRYGQTAGTLRHR